MKPVLIACDLDGTLMSPDHMTVTKRTYNALLTAHEKGVKIAIATGRTLGFTDSVTEQIPFVDYVIYSNGACVYDRSQKKDVYRNRLTTEQTAEILKTLSEMELYYNAYVDGEIYVQRNKAQFYKNHELPQRFLEQFMRIAHECEDMEKELLGREAEIIAMYSMNSDQMDGMLSKFNDRGLHITSSLPDELEVTAPGVNKGTAIVGLCEAAGFNTAEVMAFGDAMNDYEMIKSVGLSYAMGNACEELKAAAKFVTLTNAEDGVAAAIEKIL